ncbi:MAG: DNA-3-methyladenine glycosylase I [Candidatus Nanoarchaeia archaeon]|nr:DNA-3-methyladenine glycosylase I [Candidatus Nanoarchaeia archaeon]
MSMKKRCSWAGDDEVYIKYHDEEWGVPVFDDKKLFEMLILESAQAGLSWIIILKKRENYRSAFDNFDYKKISKYNEEKILELIENKGIIRNKRKIESAIRNSKIFIEIQKEFGSFSNYIWGFVNNKPIINLENKIITRSIISDKISEDLKKRGMNFVGSTIIYSFMQAVGMVNDHSFDCFRFEELKNYKIHQKK